MLSVLLSALCPPAPLKSLPFWRYNISDYNYYDEHAGMNLKASMTLKNSKSRLSIAKWKLHRNWRWRCLS